MVVDWMHAEHLDRPGRGTYHWSTRRGPPGSRPRESAARQRLRAILESIQKYW